MIRYYDRDGQPLELMEWAAKFEQRDYKRVALDVIQGVRVSTVWLGLDHSFMCGPPLFFETMVFDDENTGTPLDQEQERYSSEEAALAGHARWAAAVKATGRTGSDAVEAARRILKAAL